MRALFRVEVDEPVGYHLVVVPRVLWRQYGVGTSDLRVAQTCFLSLLVGRLVREVVPLLRLLLDDLRYLVVEPLVVFFQVVDDLRNRVIRTLQLSRSERQPCVVVVIECCYEFLFD